MRPTSARLMTAWPLRVLITSPSAMVSASAGVCVTAEASARMFCLSIRPAPSAAAPAGGGAGRAPGAAAIGRDRAVAARHADLLDGYADAVGHDLSNARQRPLPLIGETGDAAHRAR